MEQTSTTGQRAFAVAKLKRAASLPRMKDGRRPPMHVEGVSEGEAEGRNEVDRREDEGSSSPDDMAQIPAAGQRAFAVVKLKRAVSLPRMKDGRRLPMHVEAVSEGEVEDRDKVDRREEGGPSLSDAVQPQDQSPSTTKTPEGGGRAGDEAASVIEDSVEPMVDSTSPAQKKRRRSRLRSRGSKYLKTKLRVVTPSPLPLNHTNNESSQDEDIPSLPPPVRSLRPSRFDTPQSRVLDSPLYPGTIPSTPMLPGLEALRAGLFRSNNDNGVQRMIAMAKSTGEAFVPATMASSPPPAGKLTRNNTVSDGELTDRMAARALLFRRLGERINTEGEQTSGGEKVAVQTPTPTKRRRRRSRRISSRASTVVDDREPSSTTPNTPPVPALPLLPLNNPADLPPSRPSSPNENSIEYETPPGRVVIEDEDDVPKRSPPLPGLPHTPKRLTPNLSGGRLLHPSDILSTSSYSVSSIRKPTHKHIIKRDVFSASPLSTPFIETYLRDEEQATYEETQRELSLGTSERKISWIAEPESRMPIYHDDEDENNDENEDDEYEGDGDDEDDLFHPRKTPQSPPLPRTPLESKSLLVEREVSPEATSSHIPPSPSSAAALSNFTSNTRSSDDCGSTPMYPAPSTVTPVFEPTTSSNAYNSKYTDWEEQRMVVADVTPKRPESTWERVKNTFTRGRRSRTNSVGTRQVQENTDSSVSRGSGASLTSPKTNKGDTSGTFAYQQSQAPVQTQTSSPVPAPALPSVPHARKGRAPPIPAASNADRPKHVDAKLFPLPSTMELEKQGGRTKGLSAPTPDIMLGLDQPVPSAGPPNMTIRPPEMTRDRKLPHQAPDTRLLARNNIHFPPAISAAPTTDFSIPSPHSLTIATPTQSESMKLPTTREGVKRWLSAKKLSLSSSGLGTTSPNVTISPALSPVTEPRSQILKKPSVSDLFMILEETANWEDVESDKPRAAIGSILKKPRRPNMDGAAKFTRVDDAFGVNIPNRVAKSNSNSPLIADNSNSTLEHPIPHDTGGISEPPPLWKLLINPGTNSGDFVSILTTILGSQQEVKHLKQVQNQEATIVIESLDRFLNNHNPSTKLRKKCLVVLRKICGRCGTLPTSYMLSEGLEKTKDRATQGGGFADVWEGTYNNSKVAIKVLRIYETDDFDRIRKRLCNEAVPWKQLSHPNILPFLGISIAPPEFRMISKWMHHGNIVHYLKRHPEKNRLELLADVGRGLQYLHGIDFVHGDLKGENILIDDAYHACLADFGLLTILTDPNTVYTSTTSTFTNGTARFMAPELFDPEPYGLHDSRTTKQSDIFALGMVILQILTGRLPFQGDRDYIVTHKVISGIRPERPSVAVVVEFSDSVWEIVEGCWHRDPAMRPLVSVVLNCLSQAAITWNPPPPAPKTIKPLEDDWNLSSDEEFSDQDPPAIQMDL